jgi:hypothetical protein
MVTSICGFCGESRDLSLNFCSFGVQEPRLLVQLHKVAAMKYRILSYHASVERVKHHVATAVLSPVRPATKVSGHIEPSQKRLFLAAPIACFLRCPYTVGDTVLVHASDWVLSMLVAGSCPCLIPLPAHRAISHGPRPLESEIIKDIFHILT